MLEEKSADKTKTGYTSGISERSVDPERLNMQQGEREEKDGKEEKKVEKKEEQKVEPLARLKAEEKQVEEQNEPLVRLVRYDSSIPNALDSILPRYIYTLKINHFSHS